MKGPDWVRGYRDGWDGAKAAVTPFQDYQKGFAVGDKDRKYGRSRHPELVDGLPGTKVPRTE